MYRDSSVGTVTCFGLKGPGIKSRRGEVSLTRPDESWGALSLLYNGYWFSPPGVKRPGRGVNHPPLSSVEVKERVELYLCSPSGPSSPVVERNFRFNYIIIIITIIIIIILIITNTTDVREYRVLSTKRQNVYCGIGA